MKWQEYLKSPIYEKHRHLMEVAERLGKPYAFLNNPVFRIMQELAPYRLDTNTEFVELAAKIKGVIEKAEESYRYIKENQDAIKRDEVGRKVGELRGLIKKDFGVDVDFDAVYERFEDMDIDRFVELVLDRSYIPQRIIEYAQRTKEDYDQAMRRFSPSTATKEKEPPKTFEELFDSPEKLAFVEQMLVDEGFCSGNTLLLGQRERFKIALLCDALKVKKILPELSDEVLHPLFAVKIGVPAKRYNRPSAQTGKIVKTMLLNYIDNRYPSVTVRNRPK